MIKKELKTASQTLYKKLGGFSWFRTIGIGKDNDYDVIIVYVEKKQLANAKGVIPETWKKFPVIVRTISKIVVS